MMALRKFILLVLFLAPIFVFGMQSQSDLFSTQVKDFLEYAISQDVGSAAELKKNIDEHVSEYPDLLKNIHDELEPEEIEQIGYVYQKKLWNWGSYPRKEVIEKITSKMQQFVDALVFDYDNFNKELNRFLLHCNPGYPKVKNAAGMLLDRIEKYDEDGRINLMKYIYNQLSLKEKQNIRARFMPKPPTRGALQEGSVDSLVEKLNKCVSDFEKTQKVEQARLAEEKKDQEVAFRRRAVSVAPAVSDLEIFKSGFKSFLDYAMSQNNSSASMLEQQMSKYVGDEYPNLLKFVYDKLSAEDKKMINNLYLYKTSGFGFPPRAEEIESLINKLRGYVSEFESDKVYVGQSSSSSAPVTSDSNIFEPEMKAFLEYAKALPNSTTAKMLQEQMDRHVGKEYADLLKFVYDKLTDLEKKIVGDIYYVSQKNTPGLSILPGNDAQINKLVSKIRLYVSQFESKSMPVPSAEKRESRCSSMFTSKQDLKKAMELEGLKIEYEKAQQAYEKYRRNLNLENSTYKSTSSSSSKSASSSSGSDEEKNASSPSGSPRSVDKLSKDEKKELKKLEENMNELAKKVQKKEKELEKIEKGKDRK